MGRMRLRTGILVTAVLAILVTALSLHFSDTDLLRTLLYTPCFLAGNLLARGRHEVHGWYSSLTLLGRLIFIGMSFLFCGYAIALRASPPITNFICLLGAIGAIIVTLNESVWRDFLRKRLQQFLGQTSYSIYLVHIPVLFSCYVLLGHRMSHTLLFICYLGCVLLFSTAFYYVVEYPSLRLSRFIGTSLHHKQQ
jgi:peptidoglycan/LPS O-acetylase OafA/YrhL